MSSLMKSSMDRGGDSDQRARLEKQRLEVMILSLHRQLRQTVDPLVGADARVALLDIPNHSNVGDSAIWLGELSYLQSRNVDLCYCSDQNAYSRSHLARKLGSGTILLHGGGNFGDLWESCQLFREDVVRSFPNNPIVLLPQTIYFRKREALERARRVFNDHPNLTLLLRDHESLNIARNEFTASSILAPDMAFCLGPLRRSRPATRRITYLLRTDAESARAAAEARALRIEPNDWLEEPSTPLLSLHQAIHRIVGNRPHGLRSLRPAISRIDQAVARARLRRGSALLESGEIVVTDRLHGHILCTLLGIPHVVIDNNYGKISSFHHAWTHDSQLTWMAGSLREAIEIAASL